MRRVGLLAAMAVAATALIIGTAGAHSWYPHECCHDDDCRPVPCADLHHEDAGYVRWGRTWFPRSMIRLSQDDLCHVCTIEPMVTNAKFGPTPVCAFVPRGTS